MQALLCERGAAAIEFALTVPALVILLTGGYAIGYAIHATSSVHYALDETARALRLDPALTSEELQDILEEKLKPLSNQAPTLSMTSTARDDGGNLVELIASYGVEIKIPMITTLTVERSDRLYVYTE
jgi:Flp pilus assembly protein TadG